MISSKNNNSNNENINFDSNKENNDENNIQNCFNGKNNSFDITPKINREMKHNIQALKRIENIILSNGNNLNDETSFKTEIKPLNTYIKKNINKTFNKPERNNNIFTYSNDEKYSLLRIKKIKSKKFSPYKSTNQLFNNVENIYDDQKNEYDSKNLFFKMNKNKRIFSLRKAYISIISYEDENRNKKDFKVFRDDDIGLSGSYKIKTLFEDDDVNSDEETINYGITRCNQHIETAIKLMQKNSKEYVSKYIEKNQKNC